MSNFRYHFPHDIINITPIPRYEHLDYMTTIGSKFSSDSYYHQVSTVNSYEIALRINDASYKKLSDYLTEKLELDEFIRHDSYAADLYQRLLTYYHLKK